MMGDVEKKENVPDELLPVTLTFSSSVSKAGEGRSIIGVPAGFSDLVRPGEAVNVTCYFPFRDIQKQNAKIQKALKKVRSFKKADGEG